MEIGAKIKKARNEAGITQEQAAHEWANFDLAVICSLQESFGVAAIEAQASGCPVIISDVPGLMEATQPGVTSMVIRRGDDRALADAIYELWIASEKRRKLGEQGRRFVKNTYDYELCFEKIESLFEKIKNRG